MSEVVPTINAQVTFLSVGEGGREVPAIDSRMYRPHIVIGDPNQRVAVIGSDGRTLTEDYLGVCFTGDGRVLVPGELFDVVLPLIYYPYQGYDKLVSGVTFTIREGHYVVGFGRVTSRTEAAAP